MQASLNQAQVLAGILLQLPHAWNQGSAGDQLINAPQHKHGQLRCSADDGLRRTCFVWLDPDFDRIVHNALHTHQHSHLHKFTYVIFSPSAQQQYKHRRKKMPVAKKAAP